MLWEPNPSTSRRKQRPPRKKACKSCTKSKIRCNLGKPACSRCRSIGRVCEYTADVWVQDSSLALDGNAQQDPMQEIPSHILYAPTLTSTVERSCRPYQGYTWPVQSKKLDFTTIELAPSSSAEDIRDHWMRPYMAPLEPNEALKIYQPFTLQYISRILSTYPRRLLRDGDFPPIFHRTQVHMTTMSLSLANCYSLVRMWEQAAPGSEAMVVNSVEKEMGRLYDENTEQNDYEHLTAFQAYLMYAIMMYFSPLDGHPRLSDKTMIMLMEMAFRTARNGILCAAELHHSRPSWESWIVAASKRRAILTMYLFSNVYNADRSLPNVIASELKGVYVPGHKTLWEAIDRQAWVKEYDRCLFDFEDGFLEISELWRSPETASTSRRKRIERWLETVDEFGTMLFAVCAHIHGC